MFRGFKRNTYYETQTKNGANHPHCFKLTAVVELFPIVLLNVNFTNANTIAVLKYCIVLYSIYILRYKIRIHHNTQATSRLQEAIRHLF